MHVEFLRNEAKLMPAVPSAADVTSLTIWHCKFETLQPISEFVNLKVLKIASYPDVSLRPLEGLKSLEWLSITHLPKVTDITCLANLQSLTTLELATLPSWDASRKRQTIKSLGPLSSIPGLWHVSLFGVVPDNKSLLELEHCKALKSARLSGFPAAEIERFFASSGVENAQMPSAPTDTV